MTVGGHPTTTSAVYSVILLNYFEIGCLLASIGVLLVIWLSKDVQAWCKKQVNLLKLASRLPGPPTLPLIGNALHFACKADKLLDRIVDICMRYDTPFRFWLGPKLLVVLTKPCDIDVIINNPSATYKDSVYRFLEPVIGHGLISGSGPTHRSHRRVIMPMLNGKILDAYVECFDRQSRYWADRLEEFVDKEEFDIHHFTDHCTVDIILETIMGIPGTTQQKSFKQSLLKVIMRLYELVHERMLKVWLHPDWIFSRTKLGKEQSDGIGFVHRFIESHITLKQKEHYAVGSNKPRVILIEQLIAHIAKSHLMDDVELRDEIYTIFTAAQDTTATISAFVILMLGMHPDIQDKVRAELDEVLGEDNVTTKSLPELKYLELVIKETLRLFPIGPFILRKLTGDVDLGTYTLPEGCSVLMVPYMTHRDPKYWVNPEKFNPERFAHENSIGRHSYAYVPFSGGLRSCVGQRYAMMCMKTIVAHIVRRYQLSCKNSFDKLKLKTDISIRSTDGYKISITRV